jgi:hypothetical protein
MKALEPRVQLVMDIIIEKHDVHPAKAYYLAKKSLLNFDHSHEGRKWCQRQGLPLNGAVGAGSSYITKLV